MTSVKQVTYTFPRFHLPDDDIPEAMAHYYILNRVAGVTPNVAAARVFVKGLIIAISSGETTSQSLAQYISSEYVVPVQCKEHNPPLRRLNWHQCISWHIIPNRCALCGKWKWWGKTPHKACEDYELSH